MDGKAFGFDMTMMYAMHDALRRELVRIARVTANRQQDPQQMLGTAVGWEMFKSYLRVHHTSEDDALWPVMSRELASRPDDLALVDAMETEHAAIDPLLNAIDAAIADHGSGPGRLGDLTDGLVTARALNTELRRVLEEWQILRIDHFLGMESAMNIMFLRFANSIFEPLWNRDHIQ